MHINQLPYIMLAKNEMVLFSSMKENIIFNFNVCQVWNL